MKPTLTLEVLAPFIKWSDVFKNPALVSKFVEENKLSELRWQTIAENPEIINWTALSNSPHLLDDNFLHIFSHKLVFPPIIVRKQLGEEYIRNHLHALHKFWPDMCKYQKLSLPFLTEHEDVLDYSLLPKFQYLDEAFIRRHWHDLDLYEVVNCQKHLPEPFIREIKKTLETDPSV